MLDAAHSLEIAQEFTVETPDTMNNILKALYENTAYDFRIWHGSLDAAQDNEEIIFSMEEMTNYDVDFSCECETLMNVKGEFATAQSEA
jgi:hypothetical protein